MIQVNSYRLTPPSIYTPRNSDDHSRSTKRPSSTDEDEEPKLNWTGGVPPWKRPRVKPSKAINCDHCREKKMKCNRKVPCSNCLFRDVECTWENKPIPFPILANANSTTPSSLTPPTLIQINEIEITRLRRQIQFYGTRLKLSDEGLKSYSSKADEAVKKERKLSGTLLPTLKLPDMEDNVVRVKEPIKRVDMPPPTPLSPAYFVPALSPSVSVSAPSYPPPPPPPSMNIPYYQPPIRQLAPIGIDIPLQFPLSTVPSGILRHAEFGPPTMTTEGTLESPYNQYHLGRRGERILEKKEEEEEGYSPLVPGVNLEDNAAEATVAPVAEERIYRPPSLDHTSSHPTVIASQSDSEEEFDELDSDNDLPSFDFLRRTSLPSIRVTDEVLPPPRPQSAPSRSMFFSTAARSKVLPVPIGKYEGGGGKRGFEESNERVSLMRRALQDFVLGLLRCVCVA